MLKDNRHVSWNPLTATHPLDYEGVCHGKTVAVTSKSFIADEKDIINTTVTSAIKRKAS